MNMEGGVDVVRLAFSTNAYTRFSLVEAIQRIHACGYKGIEILADVPHAFPDRLSSNKVSEVSRVLEQTGLSVSNINANTALGFHPASVRSIGEVVFEPSLCSKQEERRKERIDYTKRCIDLAVEWGSPCVSVTSGRCLPGNPPDQAYQYFLDSIQQVLDYAIQKDIYIGIEYEPGLLLENANEVAQMLKDVQSPNLGLNLDLGHVQVIGEPLTETIKRFADKIWNIHLEDIREHKHYHLIPGEGNMNFQEIFDALESIGYERFVTLELYSYPDSPDDAARRSLSHLEHLNKLMKG
jgi:protein FrlC